MLTVHTLNARGNVMLEVMREYFRLTPERMHLEIQAMRAETGRVLAAKGISYDRLRSALIPDRKRHEIALVFDTTGMKGWYSRSVFERLIPLLDPDGNHSILHGDYLPHGSQAMLHGAMMELLHPARSFRPVFSTMLYIVYINNLTPAMVARIDAGLHGFVPYLGHADTSFFSPFKTILSTMLVNLCVKHGRTIIQGHEDDRPDEEDVNMSGFPFAENGYQCRSLRASLEGVFLTYKIERPVLPGYEVDTEMSLNAISPVPLPLDTFTVEVEEAKVAYLRSAKGGSLERAGIEALSTEQLAALIQSRIMGSYIYNMGQDAAGTISKFNVMLELPATDESGPTRLLAALEYQPDRAALRLITLY